MVSYGSNMAAVGYQERVWDQGRKRQESFMKV